jgi:hypothetical protein
MEQRILGSYFEDLYGNKWIKLDEVQAAAPLLKSLKENFPAEYDITDIL